MDDKAANREITDEELNRIAGGFQGISEKCSKSPNGEHEWMTETIQKSSTPHKYCIHCLQSTNIFNW